MNSLIQVEDVQRHYQMGEEVVRALDGVSLHIEGGEFVGIVGPSGSGKTTLLYLLGGLDQPTSGHIQVNETTISALDENGLARYRQAQIGFVFQSFNLIPTMTAIQNVAFPLIFAGVSAKERNQRAQTLLEMVGLGDRLSHKPTELSGGQQQRVAIARALVNDPPIILADEPTGNLDSGSGGEIMSILQTLNENGRTVIMVTHDRSVLKVTTKQVHLKDGRVTGEI